MLTFTRLSHPGSLQKAGRMKNPHSEKSPDSETNGSVHSVEKKAGPARWVLFFLLILLVVWVVMFTEVFHVHTESVTEFSTKTAAGTKEEKNPCPSDMVIVPGGPVRSGWTRIDQLGSGGPPPAGETRQVSGFCMDRYEFPNRKGEMPRGDVTYGQAVNACEELEKRLCLEDEWELACAGSKGWAYVYGPERQAGGLVIGQHLLRRRHRGQGHGRRIASTAVGCVASFRHRRTTTLIEQRQLLLVLRQRVPQRCSAVKPQRAERPRLGQPREDRTAQPGTPGKILQGAKRPVATGVFDAFGMGTRQAVKHVEAKAKGRKIADCKLQIANRKF